MTKKEWEGCFAPAPPAFNAAIRQALDTKGEQHMKRIIPRTAVIVLTLLLVMTGIALSAGSSILKFLHVDQLGEVQITQPQFIPYFDTGKIPFSIEITEAVCDGQSVHVLITYTADSAALLLGGDDPQLLPFQQEREALKQHIEINPVLQTVETGGVQHYIWDNWHWEYHSAQSFTIDISLMLSGVAVGESLTLHMNTWYTDAVGVSHANELPFDVVLFPQQASQKTYKAVNLPLTLENYAVHAATVLRTDMACYVTLEVEDAYDWEVYSASFVETEDGEISTMTLPLHGSYWFHVLDAQGEALPSQQAHKQLAGDGSNDEWHHLLVTVAVPPFDVGETLTLQPYTSEDSIQYAPIQLQLQAQ